MSTSIPLPGSRSPEAPEGSWRLAVFLLASLLANWLFWTQGLQRLTEHKAPPLPQRLMAVRMLPPAAATVEPTPVPLPPDAPSPNAAMPSKQIVDLPDMNDQVPEDTRFLATRDSAVPNPTLSPVVDKPVNARQAGSPQPEGLEQGVEDAVDKEDLTQPNTVPERPETPKAAVGTGPHETPPPQPEAATPSPKGLPTGTAPTVPFDRLLEIAEGQRSAQDNRIEDVPAGEVTLLNAKSSPYADYIITRTRAAIRFMTINLPLTTWRFQDVAGFRSPLEVVALINASGEVTDIQVLQPSGSPKLDRVVSSSLRSGVMGHAPPEGAAQPDGLVHFVLILHDGWVQAGIR